MFRDKSFSKTNKTRISEANLLLLALLFGGLGIGLGMLIFRHKIRDYKFVIGIPLIIIQNSVLLYLIKSANIF